MIRMRIIATVSLISLAGCAKTADVIYAKYQPYVGRSIADFITETGQTPGGAFDNGKGERIFTFPVPVGTGSCRVIRTVPDGKIFRIVEILSWCM